MIIEFIPSGDSVDTCSGISNYSLSRPSATPQFLVGNLIGFVILQGLWVLSAIFFVVFRKQSQLAVVRPLSLNLLLVCSHLVFNVAILLNLAIEDLPCGVLLTGFLLGLAGFGAQYFVRILVYVIESQFSLKVAGYSLKLTLSAEETLSTTSGISSWVHISPRFALISVGRLAFGLTTIESLSMSELLRAKQSWTLISVVITFPLVVMLFFFLIFIPQYRSCTGCAIFLEPLLGFISVLIIYISMAVRILYVGWKLNFPDMRRVFREMFGIAIVTATPCLIVFIIYIIDPGDIGFNRIFMWEWLIACPGMLIYWWFSVGEQAIAIYQDHILTKIHKNQLENEHQDENIDLLLKEDFHKPEFEQFLVHRYAVENLHFVLDVEAYKKYFFEKNNGWKKQKARLLYETYVKSNSLMEVNISADVKQNIENVIRDIGLNDQEDLSFLKVIFDIAVDDIIRSVLKEIWTQYRRLVIKDTPTRSSSKSVKSVKPLTVSSHSSTKV